MTEARPGRELFVWYRVDAADVERARDAVEAMQRTLADEQPGLQARLLVRDDGTSVQTWMETYAMPIQGASVVDEAMQARIEAAAAPLRRWLASDRHVEAFERVERD